MAVDQKTEQVIKLSAAVETARQELERIEQLQRVVTRKVYAAHERLKMAVQALDVAVKEKAEADSKPNVKPLRIFSLDQQIPPISRDAVQKVLMSGRIEFDYGPSITARVRKLLQDHPGESYTSTDIMAKLDLKGDQDAAVRQALRRLLDAGVILRLERGIYRANPVPPQLVVKVEEG